VIGVAREVDIPLLDEVIWDGILGNIKRLDNIKRFGLC
jgi:hypothetical protein